MEDSPTNRGLDPQRAFTQILFGKMWKGIRSLHPRRVWHTDSPVPGSGISFPHVYGKQSCADHRSVRSDAWWNAWSHDRSCGIRSPLSAFLCGVPDRPDDTLSFVVLATSRVGTNLNLPASPVRAPSSCGELKRSCSCAERAIDRAWRRREGPDLVPTALQSGFRRIGNPRCFYKDRSLDVLTKGDGFSQVVPRRRGGVAAIV